MSFPEPVIGIAIEPKTKADVDKLGMALAKLAEEDPTFVVRTDEASGQTIISGMGELHLEILVDRLKREFKVEVNQGNLRLNTRKHSQKMHNTGKFTRNNPVVVVNLEILYLRWDRQMPISKALDCSLSMR